MSTITELRGKSAEELTTHLTELRKERFALRMQKASGQLGKTHETRRVRREIARVNTLLGELTRKANEGASA